jgi:hypothetical protein
VRRTGYGGKEGSDAKLEKRAPIQVGLGSQDFLADLGIHGLLCPADIPELRERAVSIAQQLINHRK